MVRDYYSVLGVGRSASQSALRRAFRSNILRVHPDRNPDDHAAAQRAREMIEAYHVLADPQARRRYDESLAIPDAYISPRASRDSWQPTWSSRTVGVAMSIAATMGVCGLLLHAITHRDRVFRPYTGVIDLSAQEPAAVVSVVHPDALASGEWCAAQQYELSLASQSSARRLIDVYSRAARIAVREGRRDRAEFYARCIRQVRRAQAGISL